MKAFIVSLFLFIFSAAYTQAGEDQLTGSVKTGVTSEYIGRVGSIFNNHPIMVNELTLVYGDWYAGVWNSDGLYSHKYGTTYADEFDFYLGWAHTFNWIKVDVSSTYYTLANLSKSNDDMWVIEPEVSLPKFPFVQPYVRARYFGTVGLGSPKGGMFYFAGLRKSISLLNLDLSTAYAGGALHDSTGFVYGRLTASVDIPVAKQWTLRPSVIYQVAAPGQRSNPNGFTDGNKFVYGVSVGYSF